MTFQVKEPILVIGLGGAGSKLALEAKDALNSDYMTISNDKRDLTDENSIYVSTGPIVNPSVPLIRGSTYKEAEEIKKEILKYSTVILMGNLAGKAGAAMAPAVSEMCKEADVGLVSFVIMPFRYEKDRIFNSGVSLKRVRENSQCTIVLDNDSLLESNPDLNAKECYTIGNSAILHVIKSFDSSQIDYNTSILTTSKAGQDIEELLRDSLKMLYGNTTPNSVKHSMLYVVGGSNIPVGVINSITSLTAGVLSESDSQIDASSGSEESKVVMLSSVQGMTKFEGYDPLGAIPQANTLDWSTPDCSIDCELDLYQLE